MNLLDSLLDAIVRLEGDAVVMHAGEKPYVVTISASMSPYRGPVVWGQVELSSRVLTADAMLTMLGQVLPAEQRHALDEFGAIEYDVSQPGQSDRFTIVAARGGDDVWLELLRRRPAKTPEPEPVAPESTVEAANDDVPADSDKGQETMGRDEKSVNLQPVADRAPIEEPARNVSSDEQVDAILAATASALLASNSSDRPLTEPSSSLELQNDDRLHPHAGIGAEPLAALSHSDLATGTRVQLPAPSSSPTESTIDPTSRAYDGSTVPPAEKPHPQAERRIIPNMSVKLRDEPVKKSKPISDDQQPDAIAPLVDPSAPRLMRPPRAAEGASLEQLLRAAAERGASVVYMVGQSRPIVRVNGEVGILEDGAVMTPADVEGLIAHLVSTRGQDQTHSGPDEWTYEVPDLGRVRYLTFRDHRGPGVIFRMVPPRAISAEQLELSAEVQALCAQPDGLVLVSGSPASGKSTLLSAFVDLINRTRSDHVITFESHIGFVHESRRAFVSQREARGSEAIALAVRSALYEEPDVLFVEDVATAEIAGVVLEAAESGCLVFGSVAAPSATAAIEQIVELFQPERRALARNSLAGSLRAIVAQILLRKIGGGRVAAREVLLNTPAIAALVLEGKTSQVPAALESGRRLGMVPLTDSLTTLVREGVVHVGEAYRKAVDRDALLAALKRDGVDTSFAERLA